MLHRRRAVLLRIPLNCGGRLLPDMCLHLDIVDPMVHALAFWPYQEKGLYWIGDDRIHRTTGLSENDILHCNAPPKDQYFGVL